MWRAVKLLPLIKSFVWWYNKSYQNQTSNSPSTHETENAKHVVAELKTKRAFEKNSVLMSGRITKSKRPHSLWLFSWLRPNKLSYRSQNGPLLKLFHKAFRSLQSFFKIQSKWVHFERGTKVCLLFISRRYKNHTKHLSRRTVSVK